MKPFSEEVIYLNNMAVLFYVRIDNDIRQVVNSINLMDMIH
jgi:hypothetical protein